MKIKTIFLIASLFTQTILLDAMKRPNQADSKQNLKIQKINQIVKNFPCPFCEKSYTRKGKLTEHSKKKHTNPLPFPCGKCNKAFEWGVDLIIHSKVHVEEKIFQCPVCSKQFFTNGHLKSHQLIHLKNKSFPCTICQQSFTSIKRLENHKVTIHLILLSNAQKFTLDFASSKDDFDPDVFLNLDDIGPR